MVASSRCRGVLVVRNLAKSISTSKTITTVGEVDFNVGPVPHVIATTRFVGTQCQKSKPGSEFKVEQVVIENSEDPNVPGEKKPAASKKRRWLDLDVSRRRRSVLASCWLTGNLVIFEEE